MSSIMPGSVYANPNLFNSIASFGAPPGTAPVDPTAYAAPNAMGAPASPFGIPGVDQTMMAGQAPVGGMPQQQGWMGKTGAWLANGQNLATVFQGISALTSAYLGFQQLKQAKDALKLQKEAFRTNLRNSTQTYNTSLEDRIRGRTSNYEGKESDVNAYLAEHSLKTGS